MAPPARALVALTTHTTPAAAPQTGLPPSGLLLLGVMVCGWGLFWPLIQVAVAEMPLFTFRALCAEGGGILLLAMARLTGNRLSVPRRDWLPLAVFSLIGTTAWFTLSATGVMMIGSGRAALLAYTTPIWAFILGMTVLKERPTRGNWIGLAGGLAGVAVLTIPDLVRTGTFPLGAVAIMAGAFSWTGATALQKAVHWSAPLPTVVGWGLVLGGLPLTVLALWLDVGEWRPMSAYGIFAVAYNIVVGVAFGTFAWFTVVKMVPISVAALSTLLVPMIGLGSSAILVDGPFGWQEIVALSLIVGSMAAVSPSLRRKGGST